MRPSTLLAAVALTPASVLAAAISDPLAIDRALALDSDAVVDFNVEDDSDGQLWKRKGGGGGRGGGGGGGGGGRPGGSSSRSSPSSNSGGRTSGGSGPKPSYGNGRYYSGGSQVPYTTGSRSPSSNIAPIVAGAAAGLAFGAIISAGLYSWYLYPWPRPYTFHNATTNANETDNVVCGCQEYGVCGCDYTDDDAYLASIIGDGKLSSINSSLASVGDYEGNRTIFVDGSLPNGTTAEGGALGAGAAMAPLWLSTLGFGVAMAWVL